MAKDVYPTDHLLEKMAARNVTWGEVLEVVNKPEVIFGPDHKGRKVLQKGKLSVVVGSNNCVITVLLRGEKRWTDNDVRTRDHGEDL